VFVVSHLISSTLVNLKRHQRIDTQVSPAYISAYSSLDATQYMSKPIFEQQLTHCASYPVVRHQGRTTPRLRALCRCCSLQSSKEGWRTPFDCTEYSVTCLRKVIISCKENARVRMKRRQWPKPVSCATFAAFRSTWVFPAVVSMIVFHALIMSNQDSSHSCIHPGIHCDATARVVRSAILYQP
jgi:hypothetical protein